MMLAGIDYSMTCPAITVGNSKDFSKCKTFYYKQKKKKEANTISHSNEIYGMHIDNYACVEERFDNISEWAMAIFRRFKVTAVCIEGYAFCGRGAVFDIGENTGLLKHKMWKNDIKYFIAPPKTIKKYFSGSGNASKEMMHEAFKEKTGVDVSEIFKAKPDKSPISDIVDSYAILCYGIDEANLLY